MLFYDPFCTCSWSGLGCNLGITHCLDLTSLIGWVVSEVRELFFCVSLPFLDLYTLCILLGTLNTNYLLLPIKRKKGNIFSHPSL